MQQSGITYFHIYGTKLQRLCQLKIDSLRLHTANIATSILRLGSLRAPGRTIFLCLFSVLTTVVVFAPLNTKYNKMLPYEITPMQLNIYLQFAIKFAENNHADLPKAKELSKELMRVNWDKDAMLIIDEKPF